MGKLPKYMEKFVTRFSRMPGLSRKTAERLAFYILRSSMGETKELAEAVLKMRELTRFCRICNNLSEEELCPVCKDESRDKKTVCVIEQPGDILAIEKTGQFRGVYHVLLGRLSPLDGIGPDELKIKGLIERVKNEKPREIIIATNSDTEGEATSLYLTRVLKPYKVKLTRIAYGIPVGGDLEYAERSAVIKSLEGRREI